MSQDNAVETFSPGTVVAQYVNDNERFVGVVVGDHMIDCLHEKYKYSLHSGGYHICLLLGWFEDCPQPWSIFSERLFSPSFPQYVTGSKKTATPVDLTEEIALLKLHRSEGKSRGLNFANLRKNIFGFSAKRAEILELVYLVNQYKKYKQPARKKKIPEWIKTFSGDIEKFFIELQRAIQ